MIDQSHIRNFCIIAHIDHGKSTLADRLLEITGTVQKREMQEQLLDSNPIERERGITIKLAPVRMSYQRSAISHQIENSDHKAESGELKAESYILNLIDTPGHVDFSYEVSRSLAACEGAVLVVDATQGVQAQTLANLNLARKQNLVIIPVINKVDLPNAQVEKTLVELAELGFEKDAVIAISAKTGKNVDTVLNRIIEKIPPPSGNMEKPLRALVFSSQYDIHKGVVVYVRIVDGNFIQKPDLPVRFMISNAQVVPIEIGYFMPKMQGQHQLFTGEVGYIGTGLKDASLAKVGDTITISQVENIKSDSIQPLSGYKEPKPMVFLGLYPIQNENTNQVREVLDKLRLSDSAFSYRPIYSQALGHGFHCGFLGLLHAEVVQERLSREFGINLLATAPTVEYKIKLAASHQPSVIRQSESGELKAESLLTIQSASEFPDPSLIEQSYEPVMEVTIFSPKDYVGAIMQLAQSKRAEYIDLTYVAEQAKFTYLIPLSEMIVDFFDRLKSASSGYASLDYEFFDYQPVDLVKMDILLNHEKVDAFAQLAVNARAEEQGRDLVDKLKDEIPRQQFVIPVQAAIGGRIVARADVKPFRKDVTKKLYGGDRTRKDKLLEAQKKGKSRMKMVGKVEIPPSAFLKVFKKSS